MKKEDWKQISQKWLDKGKGLRWALLVILVGVVLLCIPTREESREAAVETTSVRSTADYDVSALEEKLAQVLSQIDGVGEVSVVLTLKSGTRQVYATEKTESSDSGGSDSEETVARISTGSGTEAALEVMEVYPTFQGALIVCDGGNIASVQLAVTRSVAALTGLSTEKISVCGRK